MLKETGEKASERACLSKVMGPKEVSLAEALEEAAIQLWGKALCHRNVWLEKLFWGLFLAVVLSPFLRVLWAGCRESPFSLTPLLWEEHVPVGWTWRVLGDPLYLMWDFIPSFPVTLQVVGTLTAQLRKWRLRIDPSHLKGNS